MLFVGKNVVFAALIIGFSYLLAGNKGLPNVLVIMGVLILVYTFVTTRTTIGRRVYAMGGNKLAAQLSGIRTERLTFLTFVNMGALAGLAAFACVVFAAPAESQILFSAGVALIGFGGGLFGHGTLTAFMDSADKETRGLALGDWGAAQETAAGLAIAASGFINDFGSALSASGALGVIRHRHRHEAQHHALFVRLHAVEARGEPEQRQHVLSRSVWAQPDCRLGRIWTRGKLAEAIEAGLEHGGTRRREAEIDSADYGVGELPVGAQGEAERAAVSLLAELGEMAPVGVVEELGELACC